MSWQDDLRQLDAELSAGEISIDEHRRRRDDLLATASSTAATKKPPAHPPAEQPAEQPKRVDENPAAAQETPSATAPGIARPADADPNESELSDPPPWQRQSPPAAGTQVQPSSEQTQHVQPPTEQTQHVQPSPEQTQHVQPPWQQQPWQQQPSQQQPWQQWQSQLPQPGQLPPGQWPPPPSQQSPAQQSAGADWQPSWNQQWEPGPGGRPFDPFAPKPGEETDSAATTGKPSGKRVIALVLAGVLVLAVAGTALWYFVVRDNGQDRASGGGKPPALPTDVRGMFAAIPELPGAPNSKIGPTIPTDTGVTKGLYPQNTADMLSSQGTRDVVYKASVDGSRQYGVLAVPSKEPGEVYSAIVEQQRLGGWRQAGEPGTPSSGTGLALTKHGVTFHRVLYNAGKWTIFLGASPDRAGDDGKIRQDFGKVVRSVTESLPPGTK
ncbi:MAG: hypothetical protein ACRDQ5_09530 [Sciscionella sp.]